MKQWEPAYEDWKAGMKYKKIADKYGVSESTVKSWATRYFKSQKAAEGGKKVATKGRKKLQPPAGELQPKSPAKKPKARGAPLGNDNAAGNSGGAPPGNTNHLKHGLYSKVYLDALDETEKALLDEMTSDEEQLIIQQIDLFTIRERRLLMSIKQLREKMGGLSVSQVIRSEWKKEKSKTEEPVEEWSDDGEKDKDGRLLKHSYHLDTYTISNLELIQRLESELTRVQARKIKAIETLNKLRQIGGGEGNGNIDQLTASIDAARETWGDEDD